MVEALGVEGALDAESFDDRDAHGGERLERLVVQLGGRGSQAVGVDAAVPAVLLGETRPDFRVAQCVRQELVQHPVDALVARHAALPVEEGRRALRTFGGRADLLHETHLGVLEQRLDERREQTRLTAEIVGHQRTVHPGLLGDGRHGQLGVAALCEDVLGGSEDAARGRRQLVAASWGSGVHDVTVSRGKTRLTCLRSGSRTAPPAGPRCPCPRRRTRRSGGRRRACRAR